MGPVSIHARAVTPARQPARATQIAFTCFNPRAGGEARATAEADEREHGEKGFNPRAGGEARATRQHRGWIAHVQGFNPRAGGEARATRLTIYGTTL